MIQFNNSCIQSFQTLCAGAVANQAMIYVCSGAQPVVDATTVNFTMTNVLASATVTLVVSGSLLKISTAALNVSVLTTGTATHFVIRSGYNGVCGMIGTVSTQAVGTSPLLLSSINLVSGGKVDFLDLGINLLSY